MGALHLKIFSLPLCFMLLSVTPSNKEACDLKPIKTERKINDKKITIIIGKACISIMYWYFVVVLKFYIPKINSTRPRMNANIQNTKEMSMKQRKQKFLLKKDYDIVLIKTLA